MEAPYKGVMEPVYPCRGMPTRHCPAIYSDVCGSRSCARYENDDEEPWRHEMPEECLHGMNPLYCAQCLGHKSADEEESEELKEQYESFKTMERLNGA